MAFLSGLTLSFQHLRDEQFENLFHTSDDGKVPIKLMRSCGYYYIGPVEKLNSEAIEFPYDVRSIFPSKSLS